MADLANHKGSTSALDDFESLQPLLVRRRIESRLGLVEFNVAILGRILALENLSEKYAAHFRIAMKGLQSRNGSSFGEAASKRRGADFCSALNPHRSAPTLNCDQEMSLTD